MVLGEGSTRAQASSHTALGERGSEQELQGEEKLARRVCSEQRPCDWMSLSMGGTRMEKYKSINGGLRGCVKVTAFSPHSARQTFSPSRSTHRLKCKAVTPEEPGVQNENNLAGFKRRSVQPDWLLVGASQRPGGPANGRRVRTAGIRGHMTLRLRFYPGKTSGTGGAQSLFWSLACGPPNNQFSTVTDIAAILNL